MKKRNPYYKELKQKYGQRVKQSRKRRLIEDQISKEQRKEITELGEGSDQS